MPNYKKCYIKCTTDKTKPYCPAAQRCTSSACQCSTDIFSDCIKCTNGRRYIMVEQIDEGESTQNMAGSSISDQEQLCKAEAEVRRLRKLLKQNQHKCKNPVQREQNYQDCKERVTVINDPCNCGIAHKPRRSRCNCECEECCKIWRSNSSIPNFSNVNLGPRRAKPVLLCRSPRRYPPPLADLWCNTEVPPFYNSYCYGSLPPDPYYMPSYASSQSRLRQYIPEDFPTRPQSAFSIRNSFAQSQLPLEKDQFIQETTIPEGGYVTQIPLTQASYTPQSAQQQPSFIEPSTNYIRQASFVTQGSFMSPSVILEPSSLQDSFVPPSGNRDSSFAQQRSFVSPSDFRQPSVIAQGSFASPSAVREPSFIPQGSFLSPSGVREPSFIQQGSFVSPSGIREQPVTPQGSFVSPSGIREASAIPQQSFVRQPAESQQQFSRVPSMIQGSQIIREPSQINRGLSQSNQGTFSFEESESAATMHESPFIYQKSQVGRGPSMIQGSQIDRLASAINQEPQMKRGPSMIQAPEMNRQQSTLQQTINSRVPSMIESPRMSQESPIVEPGVIRSVSVNQGSQMNHEESQSKLSSRGPSMAGDTLINRGPSNIQNSFYSGEPQKSIQEQDPLTNRGPPLTQHISSTFPATGFLQQLLKDPNSSNSEPVLDSPQTSYLEQPSSNQPLVTTSRESDRNRSLPGTDWAAWVVQPVGSRLIFTDSRSDRTLPEPSNVFDTEFIRNLGDNQGQTSYIPGGADQISTSQRYKHQEFQSPSVLRQSATYFPSNNSSQRTSYIAQRPMSRTSVTGIRRGAKRNSYEAQLPPDPDDSIDYNDNNISNHFTFF